MVSVDGAIIFVAAKNPYTHKYNEETEIYVHKAHAVYTYDVKTTKNKRHCALQMKRTATFPNSLQYLYIYIYIIVRCGNTKQSRIEPYRIRIEVKKKKQN